MASNSLNVENKMGTMPIGKLIITMSGPAVLSMLIQAFYNIVDTYFVSSLGEGAVAAVTYIFPVNMLMIAFGVGTGVGINSLISRRLGAKRFKDADDAASHGFILAFFNWALFLVFGLFFSEWFMHKFTQDTYIIENGAMYLKITSVCCIFVMVQVINEKILQSTGNMVYPMLCSLTGAITNVILDPILIFGIGPFPKMGVTGAAVATVIGQLLSMILGLYLMFGKEHPVNISYKGFKFKKKIIKDIYQVGAPAIVMQAVGSVMNFGLNMILAGISDTSVAVLGIYQRLQTFVFMPCFGLTQGTLPVLGYNYGARDKKRFMDAYKVSLKLSFSIMGAGFILFQLFASQLMGIFHAQGDMYEMGVDALRIICICFLPAAYGIMTSNIFQATGYGMLSLFSSLIRQLIGVLPTAYILSGFMGVTGVWFSFPLAEILGTIYLIFAYRWLYKKKIKNLKRVEYN